MPAARPSEPPKWLTQAAQVAREEGVTIAIEIGARVYRIAPGGEAFPMTASEKDLAACDEAFGVSD